jgi:glycosyltransferase involved in cell wall biosynthesis
MNKPTYMEIPPWDGKTEVSVIMPFCNEGPNVIFTAQSLVEELEGFCKYEIILIDNQSDWYINCSVKNENMPLMEGRERPFPIRSRAFFQGPPGSKRDGSTINTWLFRQGIIKYLQYDVKQGHWNAKNHGIRNSKGKYLFFLDAHCIMKRDSVRNMVQFLRDNEDEKIGGVHAYINYMLDSRSLEYRPQRDKFFGYQFCTHQSEEYSVDGKRKLRFPTEPYKVCVMSTCGMMSPRSVFEELGSWHPEFGIYSGGEGYINFKQSTCGYHHWIHPAAWCWHWAEKRGYQYWHKDFVRNEQIAAFVNGGEPALQFCIKGRKSTPSVLAIAEEVRQKCKEEREYIEGKQVETLEDYFARWVASPGVWK